MGYEIKFSYHERLESGYDKDNTKEMTKKLGSFSDDITLEKCANVVLGQLARRDIWVTDVEIHEYKKQKITFKETKGGIVIKNKKFILDQNSNLITEDVKESTPHNSIAPIVMPHNTTVKRPIKWVVLDGDAPIMRQIKQKGLQLTPGKRYPVFQEMPDPRDKRVGSLERNMVVIINDDHNREITVSSDYFLPPVINLLGGDFEKDNGPKLMYDDTINEQIPDLRSRR